MKIQNLISNLSNEYIKDKAKFQRLIIIVMITIFPLMQIGCVVAAVGVGAAAGAGTIAYLKGELKALEDANIDRVWRATEGAVNELNFIVTNKVKDAVSAKLDALTADNKSVHITLKRKTDSLTEITIRIGTFGNEELSRLILEKIQKRL